MNKRILNEVKRNRELMGINESELDEQGFLRGVRDGIKKGFEAAKDFLKDKFNKDGDEVDVDKVDNDEMLKSGDYGLFSWEMYPEYTLFFYKGQNREVIEKKMNFFLNSEFDIDNPLEYKEALLNSKVDTTTGEVDGYKVKYKVPNNLIDEKLNVD